ncbi:hypothetical protein BN938_3018 [Mucinivorans hirudinis]|uniref:Uncharacterized protein n=1 Tax=Mucinivorans hirudinis TaxID=1433126 RepID=A0A060RBS8_9BACT|nr:hypothetical protein BN938_3018 [Mucinivorans hirudinis]
MSARSYIRSGNIVLISIAATMSGADSWGDVEDFGNIFGFEECNTFSRHL